MADDTPVEVATEVKQVPEIPELQEPVASVVAAHDEPSQPQDAEENRKANAPVPAATGKHAREDDDVRENGTDLLEEDLPLRKKAKTVPAAGSAMEHDITESVDGLHDDPDGDSMKSSSSDGKDSTSSPDDSSQQAAPGIAVPGLRTSFGQPAASGLPGVRTSFGANPQAQCGKKNVVFMMHDPLTAEERDELIASVRDSGSLETTKRKLKFVLGPLKPEYFVGNTWLEVWESVIDKWCEAFVSDNQGPIAEIGLAPSLLKSGLQRQLDTCRGHGMPIIFTRITNNLLKNADTSRLRNFGTAFKPNLKKLARRKALREAEEAEQADSARNTNGQITSSLTPTNGGEQLISDPATNPALPVDQQASVEAETNGGQDAESGLDGVEKEDGEINSADASGVDMEMDEDSPPISQAELDQRHRYFPGIPDDAIFCLTCAALGHSTESCPERTCKFCGGAHYKYQCPTRQRCTKCKQLGHNRTSCQEKLAIAPGEAAIQCAICDGHDHTEINCIQLYQIYRPQPGNIKKVKELPIFCYACGTPGHYGGDCFRANRSVPPTKTWTMATASLYIDPDSENVARCFQNALAPVPEVLRPNIPGRSIRPQTHVIFESDDEADGAFLASRAGGPSSNKRAKQNNGKPKNAPAIKIASNINFGAAAPGPWHPQQQPQRQQQHQQQQQQQQKQPQQQKQQPKQQKQPKQHQHPKKQKGPGQPQPQPQNKSKKPGNNALPGTKPQRPRQAARNANAPLQDRVAFAGAAPSQQQHPPPPPPNQGGGAGRGGGGGGGPGRGGKRTRHRNPRGGRA